MTNDTTRPNDWTGDDWARDEPAREGTAVSDTEETAAGADRWNKSQWVGDQGDGAPAPEDPDLMPEGESDLSGKRHAPGEQHWARGQAGSSEPVTGDRDLAPDRDRSIDGDRDLR